MSTPRFYIYDYHHGFALGELHMKVITDELSHLHCRYTSKPLRMHLKPDHYRGWQYAGDPYFCFVEWQELEEIDPGDHLHHVFHMPAFGPDQERWYYFYGYQDGVLSNSVSAIFHVKFHEESEMITLGIWGEAETLEGEVKLEAGDNITLTRRVDHNSIIIAAPTAGAPVGFGFPWYVVEIPELVSTYATWRYDQLTLRVAGSNNQILAYTDRHELFNFKPPHSFEVAAALEEVGGSITEWITLVYNTLDLDIDPTQHHIGWYHWKGRLYATNANGLAQTKTEVPNLSPSVRKWLKWSRHDAQIDFSIDGAWVATHVTNLPGAFQPCRWLSQVIGDQAAFNQLSHSHPRYGP